MAIDIGKVKESNPLPATIERFTGQTIEKHKIYAPWRQESTPSVHVYEDGSWWDYGAGFGGDVIDFVGRCTQGDNYDFQTVVDLLGGLDIKPLPQRATKPKPQREKAARPFGISLETIMHWHDTMPTVRREYWYSRGLDDRTINEFFLGWDGKRYTIPALYRLQPFGVKRRQSDIDDGIAAKYTQIAGGKVGIFNADCLWTATKCIICEGEIDTMLLHQLGYHAVSSTGGAGSWKAEWAKFFTHVRDLVILYDNDEAGSEGANKVRSGMRRAKIVTLPAGVKDVGELWATGSAASWLKENI